MYILSFLGRRQKQPGREAGRGTMKRQFNVFETPLHDVFAMPKTNKFPRPDTPRQRQQTKISSPCVEVRYTQSEPTQDTWQPKSTTIKSPNRPYPIDDTVLHHPNDMKDTSRHGVHPWSWRTNTKHYNTTEPETNHDTPETQVTTTSTGTSMDPKATDRQPIDRAAGLDSNTDEQLPRRTQIPHRRTQH
jgi:hypothetical protein